MNLDYWLVETRLPLAYCLSMDNKSFRDRVLKAMKAQGMKKAELCRQSGVPYHTIDKFLKRDAATTGAENAAAIARVLGLTVDENGSYEELRSIFNRLSEERQRFAIKSLKGLLED